MFVECVVHAKIVCVVVWAEIVVQPTHVQPSITSGAMASLSERISKGLWPEIACQQHLQCGNESSNEPHIDIPRPFGGMSLWSRRCQTDRPGIDANYTKDRFNTARSIERSDSCLSLGKTACVTNACAATAPSSLRA